MATNVSNTVYTRDACTSSVLLYYCGSVLMGQLLNCKILRVFYKYHGAALSLMLAQVC